MRAKPFIYFFICLFFLFFSLFLLPLRVKAFEITSDLQYIVINFSDTFHYLDWSAPEEKWEKEVKPKATQRLRNIKALLTTGKTLKRQLAWSTLLEYMNYPLDTPSQNSPYIMRVKRIMELAQEEQFPVFIPLNGVQWWDELPELWNWWDYDGNQTPGCANDDYKNCRYKKLQDPSYRKRFIDGYNQENKWNVDWEDYKTPMKFAIRNWGNGDIFVAPSPNLADHKRTKITFHSVQKERYEAILKTIASITKKWDKENKLNLFAGISIGTEITLNGALIPGDSNYKPYGYRAVQDFACSFSTPTCGTEKNWSYAELTNLREKVIHDYLNDFVLSAYYMGFPKQRIYTHVWSEASLGELRYMDAIGASVNYFSRIGMSIYGKALNPLGFPLLYTTLQDNGFPAWAAPEFAPLNRDEISWQTALSSTLEDNTDPAKLIDIYNETDILKTPAIPALYQMLQKNPVLPDCQIEETQLITQNFVENPQEIKWKVLADQGDTTQASILFWKKNSFPSTGNNNITEIKLPDPTQQTYKLPSLEWGYYFWAIKRKGCDGEKWTISTPHVLFSFPALPEVSFPWWFRMLKRIFPHFLPG